MENSKKMIIFAGLVLVLIFGIFGTYVHFTKQDLIISTDRKDNASENKANVSNENKSKSSDDKVSNNDNDTSSTSTQGDGQSNTKTTNDANTKNNTTINSNGTDNDNDSQETSNINLEISYVSYTVVKGDTLTSIWRKNIVCYPFSVAKEMILNKNDITSAEELKPGQKIEIPVKDSKGYTKYAVKQGDNLTIIAEKFLPKKPLKDAIDAITKVNGSENVNNIEIDQVLLIPTK